MSVPASSEVAALRSQLEAAFRERIRAFYAALQITPPYDSVEKAGLALHDALGHLQEPALQALAEDPAVLARLFTRIVSESGLAKKHRGIIRNLLANGVDRLPPDCRPFAEAFRE